MNRESIIGKNIICGGAGIGEIIDIGPLNEGGDEFYKVSFPKEKCVNYFSIKNKSNCRILASEGELNDAINIFKTDFEKIQYQSVQEKINKQKEMLKVDNVADLARNLSILNCEKELHAQISKPFKESLNTFIDEIMFVLDLKHKEVCSILEVKLPTKKAKKASYER